MAEVERIAPKDVKERLKAGKLLLVCAYEDEAKFKSLNLEGAISLSEFKSRLPSLPKDREVVFYCA